MCYTNVPSTELKNPETQRDWETRVRSDVLTEEERRDDDVAPDVLMDCGWDGTRWDVD